MTSKTLPFHADTVGSYLRSQPLKEARANAYEATKWISFEINYIIKNKEYLYENTIS